MIAELAAANAAFGVIKEAIANGKELYEAGEALADYFGLKARYRSVPTSTAIRVIFKRLWLQSSLKNKNKL